MPKIKTHKSTAKRIKVTGTGKILIGRGFQNHKRSAKSKRSKRMLGQMHEVPPGQARRIRQRVPGLSPKNS
jgi:large subunit ribosomal protein L35